MQDMETVRKTTIGRYLSEELNNFSFNLEENLKRLAQDEYRLQQAYPKHNSYVICKESLRIITAYRHYCVLEYTLYCITYSNTERFRLKTC